jgi:hypothetical protein
VEAKCRALQAVQRPVSSPRECGGAGRRRERKPKGRTIGGSAGSAGGSSKISNAGITGGSRSNRRRLGAGSSVDTSVRARRRRRGAGRVFGSSSCKAECCLEVLARRRS